MKASRLPSSHYRVNLYLGRDPVSGKDIRKSVTASGKRECIKKATEYLENHDGRKASTSVLSSMEEYCRVKEATLSVSTIKSYYGIIRDFENNYPDFCRQDIYGYKSQGIQAVIDDLHEKRHETVKTIRNKTGFLAAVCRYKNAQMPEYTIPQKERVIYHIPESRSVKKMLAFAKEENTELWVCIMLAATGPLREGEISALSVKDIDFKKNVIHVRHSRAIDKNNQWVEKVPKTFGSDRYLKMSPELLKAIKQQGYVTNWTPRQIYEHFKRLLKKHRIKDCRFHDLRHYCVSFLKAQGYSDVDIAARTGHTNLSTLQNIYTHVLDSQHKKAEKAILKEFSKSLGI